MRLRIKGKEAKAKWRFAVDRGGTFTDVIGIDPDGKYHIQKLLSRSPEYRNASIEGIKRILKVPPDQTLSEKNIEAVRIGTTIATNSLLERKGGRVALFITEGFSDVLEIGDQCRPDIFSLNIEKPSLLYTIVNEVSERIDSSGKVVKNLDTEKLRKSIRFVRLTGVDTVAVVLMNSWKNPAHEILCEKIIREEGLEDIVLSHRTSGLIKIVGRGQSTVVDAYLSSVIDRYREHLEAETGDVPVEFMQSSGGLSDPYYFRGKDAILSGPAGGVVAVAKIAAELGIKGVIGFDMGGTSTDVSRFEEGYEKVYEKVIGGVEIQTEMMNINTIASGGGSVLWFDGKKLRVGPESAGALPGPACYGLGGPLTITDANAITGRLVADRFPKTFGEDRKGPINIDASKELFGAFTEELNRGTDKKLMPQDVAMGFIRIADEMMAMAIKEISVSKGFDIREHALVCFGGAGGQHACGVASLLDIDTIVFHPLGSLMSAYGIGMANSSAMNSRTLMIEYDGSVYKDLEGIFSDMMKDLAEVGDERVKTDRKIDLRVKGANTYITVQYDDGGYEKTVKAFGERHKKIFGFFSEDKELELVNARIEVSSADEFFSPYKEDENIADDPSPLSHQWVQFSSGNVDVPVFERTALKSSGKIKGPALVVDDNSTLLIDTDFEGEVKDNGIIMLKRITKKEAESGQGGDKPDPVLLEVFNNLFMGISTEMGYTLQNTAHSVNMKERLDFSCAIFDSEGNLVANAPHIPVHLGSMSDTVKAVLADKGDIMQPGDAFVTNNPFRGGSHLPDITVVCPVFADDKEIIFFTASRGHHADIGGRTPGSFPPDAEHIDDEGALIDGELLLREGEFMEEDIRWFFSMHKHGVRNEDERIADLKA
ncbi:MAG: hydantoinase B/oxoprolinase family protein, partial [Nitrospirota bacterium]